MESDNPTNPDTPRPRAAPRAGLLVAILSYSIMLGCNLPAETTHIPTDIVTDIVKSPTPRKRATPTREVIPKGYKLYENQDMGLSLAIPSDWQVGTSTEEWASFASQSSSSVQGWIMIGRFDPSGSTAQD